ncbi:MAG: glutathione S-transferase family protein [Acidimicrobiales bacterium]
MTWTGGTLKLAGNLGSPYSMKMRAVLRYRRIPFDWVPRGSKWDDLPDPPVPLMPAISFPDAQGDYPDAMIDSSPLIMRLESLSHDRSIVPVDPALAFLDFLLEDYGDEWVTKQMFHYRWWYEDAAAKAGKLLPLDLDEQMPTARHRQFSEFMTDRQQGRMALVGCTEGNRPVIEGSYERLLDIFEAHLTTQPYLLGDRPGRGDFGIFGQFSQLISWDPESARVAIDRAPRVVHWVNYTDDLSWLPIEGDSGWIDAGAIPTTLTALLAEVGRTYAPFLLANAAALVEGADEVVCQIDGHEFRQGPFAYQGKCLSWLRGQYEGLDPDVRSAVDDILDGSGCETLFS